MSIQKHSWSHDALLDKTLGGSVQNLDAKGVEMCFPIVVRVLRNLATSILSSVAEYLENTLARFLHLTGAHIAKRSAPKTKTWKGQQNTMCPHRVDP
ncbi:hypothetical protein ACU8KH_02311 [Lachancea thermotolerans]